MQESSLCCFSGGTNQYTERVKVVYKPRDMEIEASIINDRSIRESAFNIINEVVGETVLPTCMIVTGQDDNGKFGFMEFIEQSFRLKKEGENPEAVDAEMTKRGLDSEQTNEFYERVGALQFAAQLFGTTDLNPSNVFVTDNNLEGYYLCPIDLETSYDTLVLKGGYPTGLAQGLVHRKKADNNFIIRKDGISPRGHRMTLEDHNAIFRGFTDLQEKLIERRDEVIERLLEFISHSYEFEHRYVPVPTADLTSLVSRIDLSDDECGEQFVDLIVLKFSSDAETYGGESYILGKTEEIKEAFLGDRSRGDIPYFSIENGNGIVKYNEITIGKLEGTEDEQRRLLVSLNDLVIQDSFQVRNALQ